MVTQTATEFRGQNLSQGDGYWCSDHGSDCSRRCSGRRWGRYGAAGILFFDPATQTFLLNQRSNLINHGGRWSTLGGAINRDESVYDGAVREATEEIGSIPVDFSEIIRFDDTTTGTDGDWTYTTIVVGVTGRWAPESGDWESMDNQWVTLSEMATLPLHPSFRKTVHTILAGMYQAGAFKRQGETG